MVSIASTGIVLALLTGLVILGGIKSIARTASILVPFTAVFYMAGCLFIILRFAGEIHAASFWAFTGTRPWAVSPVRPWRWQRSAWGGAGFSPGESSLGNCRPLPPRRAMPTSRPSRPSFPPGSTFLDIVVCTLTRLALVVTGVWTEGQRRRRRHDRRLRQGLPGQSGGFIPSASAC
ncbi:MAG: alanine:cation symporter family protein [Akkermansiaceae bacterium]|nr:alanine:cation symporter family protein [Akkermansiaceae bacterium]